MPTVKVSHSRSLRSSPDLVRPTNRKRVCLLIGGASAMLFFLFICTICSLSGRERSPNAQSPSRLATSFTQATLIGTPQATAERVATQQDRATVSVEVSSLIPKPTSSPSVAATLASTLAPSITAAPPTIVSMAQSGSAQKVEVHFIDVGQGDATLIRSLGADVLIDGGGRGSGIVSYLRNLGVRRLSLVVSTHPHEDQIGGLIDVLQQIPVDRVVTNGQQHTTRTYEQFVDAIAVANAAYYEVKRGDRLLAGGLVFEVLHPASLSDNLNEGSLVLWMAHGNVRFLFTGDIEQASEKELATSGQNLNAQILKVAHSGSNTSSSIIFLQRVQPRIAVYSAGNGNPYGHPHQEALANLASVGAQVWGTDVNGTIVVVSDGSGYQASTSRSGVPRAPPSAIPERMIQAPIPSVVIQPTAPPIKALPTSPPAATATANPRMDTQPAVAPAIEVISLTSPIAHGANATLSIKTTPGAACAIAVYYKSGLSEAAGLGPQNADSNGIATWQWKVGTRTTPGTWRIVVTATASGQQSRIEIPFEVR